MLDNEPTGTDSVTTESGASTTTTTPRRTSAATTTRRRGASRPAGPPTPAPATDPVDTDAGPSAPADAAPADAAPADAQTQDAPVAKKATRKRATKKATAKATAATPEEPVHATEPVEAADAAVEPTKPAKRTRKRTTAPSAEPAPEVAASDTEDTPSAAQDAPTPTMAPISAALLFQAPEAPEPARRRRTTKKTAPPDETLDREAVQEPARTDVEDDDKALGDHETSETGSTDGSEAGSDDTTEEGGPRRRRRGGRGRRGRGRSGSAEHDGTPESGTDGTDGTPDTDGTHGAHGAHGKGGAEGTDESHEVVDTSTGEPAGEGEDDETGDGTRRRRRRRRRGGGGDDPAETDDPPNTVVRVREPRKAARSRSGSGSGSGGAGGNEDDDGVRSIKGSTRLEAKKQRRREGRDAGRKRPSIITEAEFLARRESVQRTMIVRQSGERTQIAVLEDGVLVEHYVARADSAGIAGNVYLGKVQNVLPSMEAAFIDVGKGRNAVLYAGEVNWDAAGLDGQPKRIEQALKSGDSVLVQVTKDPIGHKGARLSSQVSLAGRYLVYVPNGSMTGISRKLPDTERSRLKTILKQVVPEGAGVIVRTAAEGASEEELNRDVTRLSAQWADIDKKAKKLSAPALLYSEPDLTIRVVRDIFNEDFAQLVVSGDDAWDMLQAYVGHVAPDLADRLTRWTDEQDVFAANRVDEQLAKGLDRKVWLPSGGYLVIDRTEAMIVVDVNTGKFTGSGGNLEETVTKNNLEAAEEIVRQLRLRDLGGMIVIDFIDMVLESNRELVLRRLTECLGRDRTKHQVAEVTSLGLVQMTRKRVGQGLHEAFTEMCEHCNGRGFHLRSEPVEARPASSGGSSSSSGSGGSSSSSSSSGSGGSSGSSGSNSSGGSTERKGRGRGRGSEPKADATPEPKPADPSSHPATPQPPPVPVSDPTPPDSAFASTDADLAAQPTSSTQLDAAIELAVPVAVEHPVEPELEAVQAPRARRRRRATG
jgi:ribonuclease E